MLAIVKLFSGFGSVNLLWIFFLTPNVDKGVKRPLQSIGFCAFTNIFNFAARFRRFVTALRRDLQITTSDSCAAAFFLNHYNNVP